MSPGIGTWWRTLAPLGPSPLFHRVDLALRRRLRTVSGGKRSGPAPELAGDFAFPLPLSPLLRPIESCRRGAAGFQAGEIESAGRKIDIRERFPWNDARLQAEAPLARMKLHYHELMVDLARFDIESGARPGEAFGRPIALVEEWMESCPSGAPGHWLDSWNPYSISRRLLNWLAFLSLPGVAGSLDPARRARLAMSAAAQGEFLGANLERDLDGNHLLVDGVGLLAASRLVSGREAERFRSAGLDLLEECVDRQILPDGGHVERSMHYSQQVLTDLTDAWILSADRPGGEFLARAVEGLAGFLGSVSRAEGRLPRFGDAVPGEQPPLSVSIERAANVAGRAIPKRGEGRVDFPDSGYFCFDDGGEGIVVDGGPVAWERQPGHAHDDLFSFELDVDGAPLVVEAGTSGYGGDPFRAHCRSAAAHNGVTIDGFGSAELWGVFRLGGRSTVLERATKLEGPAWEFAGRARCWHDGAFAHRRGIRRLRRGSWIIEDAVDGPRPALVASRLHFHPSCEVRPAGDATFEVSGPAGRWVVRPRARAPLSARLFHGSDSPTEGWYFPAHGVALPAPVIRFESTLDPRAAFEISIERADRS